MLDYWNAYNLRQRGNGERIPNLAVYGISVAGYLVIGDPGCIFFKEAWINRYYGTAVFIFSAASCVVIWGMDLRRDSPVNSARQRRSWTHPGTARGR